MYISSFPTKYPHKSMNSVSHFNEVRLFVCQSSLVECDKHHLTVAYDTFRFLYELIQSVSMLLQETQLN